MTTQPNFQQKAKVGTAGNFINQMMANNSTLPEVGKGATELLYSDRRVYEVVEVSKDFKTVKLEVLETIHDKTKEGGAGHQNWVHNPTGQFFTVVWKWGSWKVKGSEVVYTDEFLNSNSGSSPYKNLTPEQHAIIYPIPGHPQGVIEGITVRKDKYSPIKLLFGVKDYHYDWEF